MNASHQLISQVSRSTDSKIVFLVIDGLGGLPHPDTGKAELETASTPNLDQSRLPLHVRAHRTRGPRNHPRQRSRPPRPLRPTTR